MSNDTEHLLGSEANAQRLRESMGQLKPVAYKPTEGLQAFAEELRDLAARIERGEIRAAAYVTVESGPDMYVTRSWSVDSGRITLIGGATMLAHDLTSLADG